MVTHRLGDLSQLTRMFSVHPQAAPEIAWLCLSFPDSMRRCVSTAPHCRSCVLDNCRCGDVRPNLVIGVDVAEAYIHCGKAFRRAAAWQPERWPDNSTLQPIACTVRNHYNHGDSFELDVATVEARTWESYDLTTWMAGGNPPPIAGNQSPANEEIEDRLPCPVMSLSRDAG
jgi:hypothetical protein